MHAKISFFFEFCRSKKRYKHYAHDGHNFIIFLMSWLKHDLCMRTPDITRMAPNQDLKGLVVSQVVGFYLMKRSEGINKHFYFGMNIVHKRWDISFMRKDFKSNRRITHVLAFHIFYCDLVTLPFILYSICACRKSCLLEL